MPHAIGWGPAADRPRARPWPRERWTCEFAVQLCRRLSWTHRLESRPWRTAPGPKRTPSADTTRCPPKPDPRTIQEGGIQEVAAADAGERLRQGRALVSGVRPDQLQQPSVLGYERLDQFRGGHRIVHVGESDSDWRPAVQATGDASPVSQFRYPVPGEHRRLGLPEHSGSGIQHCALLGQFEGALREPLVVDGAGGS